jgi:hypothetical protein
MKRQDDLESIVDEGAYRALAETQPRLIAAIRDLLDRGQTPAQIGKAANAGAGRGTYIALLVHGAAAHMARQEE